jgi:hypothetical protein
VGLFFEKTPNPDVTSMIAEGYRSQPPADNDLDDQIQSYLGRLNHPLAQVMTTALRHPAVGTQEAQALARREAAKLPSPAADGTQFKAGRFAIAILLFAALVGGGIGTDAAHMTASSAAMFGFAGSVFGLVTAFLSTEKGS